MTEVEISQSEQQEFLNALLNRNTQVLHDRVMARLKYSNLQERWFTDLELSKTTGLGSKQLQTAKSELSRSGLFTVIPGLVQTKFILPSEAE